VTTGIARNDGFIAGEASETAVFAGDDGFVVRDAAELSESLAMMAENLGSFVGVSGPIDAGPAADDR
jgi:hypothetical protein